MKIAYLLLVMVLVLLFAGCKQEKQCEAPYIIMDGECCTDKNRDRICDEPREAPEETAQEDSEDGNVLSRLFNTDKEWIEFGGTQCYTYAWEGYWWTAYGYQFPREQRLAAYERADQKEVIKEFYKEYGIEVFDVKLIEKDVGIVCMACGCPSGHSVKILVKDNDVEEVEDISAFEGSGLWGLLGDTASKYTTWINVTLPQCSKEQIPYRYLMYGQKWTGRNEQERKNRINAFFKEYYLGIMDIRFIEEDVPEACGEPSGYTESLLVKKIYADRVRALAYGKPLEEPKEMPAKEQPASTPLTEEQKEEACASLIFNIMNACVKDSSTISITVKNDGTRDIKKLELKLYKDAATIESAEIEGKPLAAAFSLKTADASGINANEITFLEAVPVIEAGGEEFSCTTIQGTFGDSEYLRILSPC